MRKIALTQNKYALVDNADFDFLTQWKWSYSHGYAMRSGPRPKKEKIYMHRLLMNTKDDEMVDHINRDALDNRKINLRLCTKSTNGMNRGKNKNNTSGYKGVSLMADHKRKNPWLARIGVQGKYIILGYFETAEMASLSYIKAANKYHKEYAI